MTEPTDDQKMSLADIYGAPLEVDVDGQKVLLGPSTPGDAAGLDRKMRFERAWDYYESLLAHKVPEHEARLERRKFAAEFNTKQLFDAMNTPEGSEFVARSVIKRLNPTLTDAQLDEITTKVSNTPMLAAAYDSCQTIPPELQARLDAIMKAAGEDGDEEGGSGSDFTASSQG